ncbi:hypothetical protein Nepgr_023290 [Nepenthes gracilis]|uniref:Smr domain-containing protein n=1 Tax=Nepenthes gracilis TaxID=150966 RepID=A0AAD3XXR6_NEPGR|nr:hypothetical protein Nepgr_023290 [Nepenthes gracilis]
MLRAKHISNLSGCARSLLYSGSRCSPTDGSSCSCSEDDRCVTKGRHRNDLILQPQSSPSVSTPTVALKVTSRHKTDIADNSPSLPQAASVTSTLGRSDCLIKNGITDDEQKDFGHPSPHITEQLVKAGIATVGFLSDLVSYKLPVSDGSGIFSSTQKYMVRPTRPSSKIKSSNIKSVKKGSFYPIQEKPSTDSGTVANSSVNYQSLRNKDGNLGHTKNSLDDRSVLSEKKNSMSQKSKVHTIPYKSQSDPDIQNSETKLARRVSHYFNKSPRDSTLQTQTAPVARQYANSGYVVESVLDVLRRLKWGPATESSLRNLNFSLDAYQANQVLKQIQDYTVALGFFYWLKRQPGFKHDGHTYTTMVGILGRAKEFDAINNFLSEMIRDGCHPNVVTYNRIIHSYGRANYLNEAVDVFRQMQEVGCQPDRVTYCTLIDIHAKAGFLDVAMYMYQRMQSAGLSPDTFTYSVIINCLGKAGHLAAAHGLFCEMVNQGCIPNLVTYNIMVALHAKARNYPVALGIYRDMQNAGYEPDKVTYSIVMEVLGQCGYLEEAEALVAEMERKNWVPDEPVYGLLVDLWGKTGNAEKALGWYQAMLNAGLYPNVPTCNSLLSAFLRVGRLVDAYNLLQSILQMGLSPSLQTYTLLLSCCTEAKSSYDMGFCCRLMSITGHPAHAFLLSMPAAGPNGQNVRDHVGRFLDLMHSEDRESKRGLVDAVVDFLHKSGLKEEAGSFWEVAAEKNVYPDAVKEKGKCYWLINLHVMSDGTAVTALSRTLAWFRRQLLVSGIGPSRIDIVTGWGRRSRVTGSSLVRQAVQDLLNLFSFPFFTENGNCGCFVGCGEPLNRWLLQSFVDRMHLL